MYVTAIVLAAGKGRRFGGGVSKPLVTIDSRPLIIHSLRVLSRLSSINAIIVVVNTLNREKIRSLIKRFRLKKILAVLEGGQRRQDSVRAGLRVIRQQAGFVLIHDACRPFISRTIIGALIKAARESGAAILGVPVKATIKSVKASRCQGVKEKVVVDKTLNRNRLWEIQTPQVFRQDIISDAYRRFAKHQVTDDAALVEKAGYPVRVVRGSYTNIKITTLEDLFFAKVISKIMKSKLGIE